MKLQNNQKIKHITILNENFEILDDGKKYNLCKCECGKVKYILNHTLRTQRIRDCGCGQYMVNKYIGLRYGTFTVVEAYRQRLNNKKINIICKCKCFCGYTRDIPYSKLNNNILCKKCGNIYNYQGKTFGCLTIIEIVDVKKRIVKCKCLCGHEYNKNLYKVTSPTHQINHCGHCDAEFAKKHPNSTCKYKNQRLKHLFYGVLDRCYNANNKDYKNYGQKGIDVYKEWVLDINKFCEWALENGYNESLSLDRIDGNKGYYPENCRWATMKQQQNNRCNNVRYEFGGKLLTVSEISDIIGINYSTLKSRIRNGMEPQKAFFTPLQRRR